MPYLYPTQGRREVNDPEVNELFQLFRKLNNIEQLSDKFLMEEHTRTTGLFRKRTVSTYCLWLNLYGGEYDLMRPIKNKTDDVSKEVMIAFLGGMLEGVSKVQNCRETKEKENQEERIRQKIKEEERE